jgi:hypothetical protein
MHSSRLILMGNRPGGLKENIEEEEEDIFVCFVCFTE